MKIKSDPLLHLKTKCGKVNLSCFCMFEASGNFDEIDCQIEGLGRIDAVEQLYVAHTQAAIDSIAK